MPQSARLAERVAEARHTLAPHGRLHAVDFGDLTGLGRPFAKLLRGWLNLFHVEPRTEILMALENAIGANAEKHNHLWILPARYAFVLNCGAGEVPAFFD